jgi:NADPH:quinone reductase-like Zn-dependent oxidoreductase
MPFGIDEFVFIDAFHARAFQDIHQLKKMVFVILNRAFIYLLIYDFKGLVKILVHIPKVTSFVFLCTGERNLFYTTLSGHLMTTIMKAITLNAFGEVSEFRESTISIPELSDNEVLIKVHALSINPVDVKTRAGGALAGVFKDKSPIILGWDVSGEVTKTGKAVEAFKVGDEVFGMVQFPGAGNAYAEYVAAPAGHLAIKPANITHEAAAAATLAALTAYQVLTEVAGPAPLAGKRVLIHAASGGVGHHAVQIAKHLGAYVIGTSSAPNKDFVLGLGADEHFDYRAQAFENVLSDIDIVLDAVGGDTAERSLNVLKKGGLVVSILHRVNENLLEKAKALGVRAANHLVYSSGKDMTVLAEWLGKGAVKSFISKVYPLNQMGAAHTSLESGRTVGKIVLTVCLTV